MRVTEEGDGLTYDENLTINITDVSEVVSSGSSSAISRARVAEIFRKVETKEEVEEKNEAKDSQDVVKTESNGGGENDVAKADY
ncbi:MAG TPA: hypothetical protein ENL00_04860, partial [Nitratifractor sp.]|nr:hypothetical protein [Nitratifractor sp.]